MDRSEWTGISYYSRQGAPSILDPLFDGDEHSLTPGVDFTTTVPVFRSALSRTCHRRGLRYRSRLVDGVLWVQVYRSTPGDLFSEQFDEQGLPRTREAELPAL